MQLFPEERQQEQTAGGGNSRQTRKEEKKRKRGRCRVGAWGFHGSGGRGSSVPTLHWSQQWIPVSLANHVPRRSNIGSHPGKSLLLVPIIQTVKARPDNSIARGSSIKWRIRT